ncbi:MAG: recombination-associated protein RdgC [Candidatus Comchoanobacterales bacterium]
MQMKQMKMYLMNTMKDQDWAEVLEQGALKSLQGLSEQNIGWTSPYGAGSDELFFAYGHFLVLCATTQKRLLPQSVVNEQSFDIIQEREEQEQRPLSKREKSKIKEEVKNSLLSQAFVRRKKTKVLINLQEGWIAVETNNADEADRVLSLMHDCFSDFHPRRVELPDMSDLLTKWLDQQNVNDVFSLDADVVMVNAAFKRNALRMSAQDLASDEIRSALLAGKRVQKLGMQWHEKISFILDDEGQLSRIKFLGEFEEAEEDEQHLSVEDKMLREFMLVIPYYQQLWHGLCQLLNITIDQEEASHA